MSEHAAVELSPEAIQFAEWLATRQKPPSEVDAARIQAEQVHLAAREPEGVTYREVDAGGVPGIWCEPVDANTDCVLLHTHAGGSVLASAHVDRKLAGHIAKAPQGPVLVLDLRRAPEHKYPAQVDDSEAAFNWLLSEGYEPGNIITIGHSIGGFLAVALRFASATRSSRCPAPSCRSPRGATSRSPTSPSRPTPGRTRSSARNCWSYSGMPGSATRASSSRTPGSI